jgi:hypothetical protein
MLLSVLLLQPVASAAENPLDSISGVWGQVGQPESVCRTRPLLIALREQGASLEMVFPDTAEMFFSGVDIAMRGVVESVVQSKIIVRLPESGVIVHYRLEQGILMASIGEANAPESMRLLGVFKRCPDTNPLS